MNYKKIRLKSYNLAAQAVFRSIDQQSEQFRILWKTIYSQSLSYNSNMYSYIKELQKKEVRIN